MIEVIKAIVHKHRESGIELYAPATRLEISTFEREMGFFLPEEFKEFYLLCNGFGCNEDIFTMIPLSQIRTYPADYGTNWFYFSEYMIYADTWGLRIAFSGEYEIFNGLHPEITMTSSLKEFLNRFLKGNIFDAGGLYEWQNELGIK